jgi:hypothetical protein
VAQFDDRLIDVELEDVLGGGGVLGDQTVRFPPYHVSEERINASGERMTVSDVRYHFM